MYTFATSVDTIENTHVIINFRNRFEGILLSSCVDKKFYDVIKSIFFLKPFRHQTPKPHVELNKLKHIFSRSDLRSFERFVITVTM